jgi:hypothetical protein
LFSETQRKLIIVASLPVSWLLLTIDVNLSLPHTIAFSLNLDVANDEACRPHCQTAAVCPQGALAAFLQGSPGGGSEGALEGVLTHSLAGLSERHVSMFLDVATILRGERRELVMAVWKAWHSAAATTYYTDLVRRSLLGIDEEGRLAMHDVLVALGRGIILQRKAGLEQHFGSRVWVQDGKVVGLEQVRLSRAPCLVFSRW